MSSREQNSEAKAIAQRDEALRQLDEAIDLQRKAISSRTSADRRCTELRSELATLKVLQGGAGVVSPIESASMIF